MGDSSEWNAAWSLEKELLWYPANVSRSQQTESEFSALHFSVVPHFESCLAFIVSLLSLEIWTHWVRLKDRFVKL